MKDFKLRFGIIPSCDLWTLEELENLVKSTCDIEGIVGYKVGAILSLKYSLKTVVDKISSLTDLPIIYDHQKLGTDIPEISGGDLLLVCKEAGINAVIIFPQAGPMVLKSTILGMDDAKLKDRVRGCFRLDLLPIVGGEMTHPSYLVKDGGYIENEAPRKMYIEASRLGVQHFVVPATKIEKMNEYSTLLRSEIENPKFLFPGIGKDYQGGDIEEAFKAVHPCPSYAIIGRAIYSASDIRDAAKHLCKVLDKFQ
jgi:orotidine-5'-phosphate decarboxylase